MVRFLSHPTVDRAVSAATQSRAMNAVLFLYRHVLDLAIADQLAPVRSRRSKRLPTVLSREEMGTLLSCMGEKCA
jgi:site-specific recombinase XerD